jgi:hypothetical protein
MLFVIFAVVSSNNITFVEFAILHHILKEIRRFDISFNSKTAMDAQQTQPSNNAGDSDSNSSYYDWIDELPNDSDYIPILWIERFQTKSI